VDGSWGGFGFGVTFLAVGGFFFEEAEDVVEDKVAVGLLSEEEGLYEFAPWVAVVGHFADDLDDDAAAGRRLCIDGVDEDLAVLEADGGDLVVDFLARDEGWVEERSENHAC